jgi:hypothetical protein
MIFAQNLSMFLLGLACQVLSGVFPKLAPALLGPATLLLSLADVRRVLDGSFFKHVVTLVLGLGCQVAAMLVPEKWGASAPLLAAGGILMSASDIKRVLRGPETPAAPLVTPDGPGATPTSELKTPLSMPILRDPR